MFVIYKYRLGTDEDSQAETEITMPVYSGIQYFAFKDDGFYVWISQPVEPVPGARELKRIFRYVFTGQKYDSRHHWSAVAGMTHVMEKSGIEAHLICRWY